MKNRFLIIRGRVEDTKEFGSGFASEIINESGIANRTAETELEAEEKIRVLSSHMGQHTYTICKLVPVKIIHRLSKPVEFETKIEIIKESS